MGDWEKRRWAMGETARGDYGLNQVKPKDIDAKLKASIILDKESIALQRKAVHWQRTKKRRINVALQSV
jgi:hypothetical protein